jgi:hypothetical protein
MTDKSKKSGEPRREMLNAGLVAVPSNRDAIIEDFKSVENEGEVSLAQALSEIFVKASTGGNHASGMGGDAALLQAAHDALYHLGAVCFPLVSDDDPTGADDGANKSVSTAEVVSDVDTKQGEVTLDDKAVDVAALDTAFEEFKTSLTQILTPAPPEVTEAPSAETPAESPAEAAAATDEVPAPPEAAEDAAVDVDPQRQADQMLMGLFATQF